MFLDKNILSCKKDIPYFRGIYFVVLLLMVLISGCSSRTDTAEIRMAAQGGSVAPLRNKFEKSAEQHQEMVQYLNLARLYQLEGEIEKSRDTYARALEMLEEYEERAIVSLRSVASGAGTILFSRGAAEYFGTGYERSLLHTFNALNYLMDGDAAGAAVELRKMEKRQEYWLLESEERIRKHVENADNKYSAEELPQAYSMHKALENPEVRMMLNGYQDAFSYVLSSLISRIVGDLGYAEVSMRRAIILQPNLAGFYLGAWQQTGGVLPRGRNLSRSASPEKIATSLRLPQLTSASSNSRRPQELVVLYFQGMSPSLYVENIRIEFPYVGYIVVDLPAYVPALNVNNKVTVKTESRTPFVFYHSLRTDLLAYRNLLDEVKFELASAFSRAASKAGTSAAVGVAVGQLTKDDDNDSGYSVLAAELATLVMDIFSSNMAKSVRNWEMLPVQASIGMQEVPRGSTVSLHDLQGKTLETIVLPSEARGVIVIIDQLSDKHMGINYVTY